MTGLSARERLLRTMECGETDHVPCTFMIFRALLLTCRRPFEFIGKQLELGLVQRRGVIFRRGSPNRP